MWKFGEFSLKLFTAVMFSASLFGAPGDTVPIDDLAFVLQLSVHERSRGLYPSDTETEGVYFQYFAPSNSFPGEGVLLAKRDQSCTGALSMNFACTINKDGRVAEDVAGAVFDKVDQLRRMEAFGGPKVYGLVVLVDVNDPTFKELGILVEHLEGRRMARLIEDRSLEERIQFMQFYDRLIQAGWWPLDFRPPNLISPRPDLIRPLDLVLTTPAEIEIIRTINPRLYTHRMIQLAHSVIAIEQYSGEFASALLSRCREHVRSMGARFPDHLRWHPSIWKEVYPEMAGSH